MNNWLLFRSPNEDEANQIKITLQQKYQSYQFSVKAGHWGSLEFFEVRILFAEKVTAEKFVEMGYVIGKSMFRV